MGIEEIINEVFLPSCMDEDEQITPTMKPKDGQLYCEHYEFEFCPYRNDKNRMLMYCNYYQHESIITGVQYPKIKSGDDIHELF